MGIFVFRCMGSRPVCEALLSSSSITANNGILTRIVQKGKNKRYHKIDLTVIKCILVLPEISSPINLCSFPIISILSLAVSRFWTFLQQGAFPDSPLGLWQGFWQLVPRVSAAGQHPESWGRTAPGPQEIFYGLVNADTMGGGELASRNHCCHSFMEERRKRKLALESLLLPWNNWKKGVVC